MQQILEFQSEREVHSNDRIKQSVLVYSVLQKLYKSYHKLD